MKTEPTEAYRMIEEDWYAIPYMGTDYPQDPDIVINRKDVYKIVEKAFQEGQSNPKIKQLEWDGKEELAFFTAKTNIGEYMIDSPHHDEIFMLMYTPAWSDESFLLHTSNSTDELKSFAQCDFEQRVKECLI